MHPIFVRVFLIVITDFSTILRFNIVQYITKKRQSSCSVNLKSDRSVLKTFTSTTTSADSLFVSSIPASEIPKAVTSYPFLAKNTESFPSPQPISNSFKNNTETSMQQGQRLTELSQEKVSWSIVFRI